MKQAFTDKFGGVDSTSTLRLGGRQPNEPAGSFDTLRDTLFGDTPLPALLATVGPDGAAQLPWSAFAQAQAAIGGGRKTEAIASLESLLTGTESRVQLLAWTALRKLGVQPLPADAKQVLGVVVEVPVNAGLDLVAAYPEHTARYYNYSGAGIVWETNDPRLNPQIDALLAAGRRVADAIGPWEGDRPAAPTDGRARISMLTPSGLHFGEAPMDVFVTDPMAGPVLQAAFHLMQALMAAQTKATSAATQATP